jgi:hypothetical protein
MPKLYQYGAGEVLDLLKLSFVGALTYDAPSCWGFDFVIDGTKRSVSTGRENATRSLRADMIDAWRGSLAAGNGSE